MRSSPFSLLRFQLSEALDWLAQVASAPVEEKEECEKQRSASNVPQQIIISTNFHHTFFTATTCINSATVIRIITMTFAIALQISLILNSGATLKYLQMIAAAPTPAPILKRKVWPTALLPCLPHHAPATAAPLLSIFVAPARHTLCRLPPSVFQAKTAFMSQLLRATMLSCKII
jgi:hypothetical protein